MAKDGARGWLTTKGRLGRRAYGYALATIWGAWLLVGVAACVAFPPLAKGNAESPPVIGWLVFAPLVLSVIAGVKRLHDLGKPGEFMCWGCLPLGGVQLVVLFVWMLFKPGQSGINAFNEEKVSDPDGWPRVS